MPLKKVILCPNPYRDKGLAAAKEAAKILEEVGIRTVACLPFRMEGSGQETDLELRPLQQELRGGDLLVAFGGDGTILHLAKAAATHGLPVLGVNLGSLGFMSELERNEMHLLRNLATGAYRKERRMMMDVFVEREGRRVYNNLGLNDAVVTKGAVARVIRMDVHVGKAHLGLVEGDGVVIATPTGSTAYSLSAGGPIVDPGIDTILMTPICPHSLHARSVLLSPQVKLEVCGRCADNLDRLVVSVDGERVHTLECGRKVRIQRAEQAAQFIQFPEKTFNGILNVKLKSWA